MKAALVPAVLLLAWSCAAPIDALIGDVPDDAFFYPVIARRLLDGQGFRFDGVQVTTGFHLPWLLLTCLPAGLGSPEVVFRGWLLLFGLTVIVAAAQVGREVGGKAGALAAFLCACAGVGSYGLGMETGITLMALWAWVGARRRPLASFLAGFLVAACRIDAVVWLLAGVDWRARRGWEGLAGGLAGILATFAFDHAVAGELLSTAVSLKGSGDLGWRLSRLDTATLWRHFPPLALVGIAGLALGRVRGTRRLPFVERLCLAGFAHIAIAIASNNLVAPWYYTPLAWALAAAGAPGLIEGSRAGRWIAGGLAIAWMVRLAPLPGPGLHTTVRAFALEVRAGTTSDAYLMTEDFPGILAFFSERAVLPADGLAGAPAWREVLARGEALDGGRALGVNGYVVSRRRSGFLEADPPLLDRIAPPFLDVPPSPVPLDPDGLRVSRVDPSSGRLFALFSL